MDISYHYPPELFDLLVDTIPLLSRSKPGVLDLLRGAGVREADLKPLRRQVHADPSSISKYKITRIILTRLNELGEPALRVRRELLKRVVEFEEFSVCWPKDQLKAQGLVAQIRKVVNVKDSFTRMNEERRRERQKAIKAREARQAQELAARQRLECAKKDFYGLFGEKDSRKRGRKLEKILTELFAASGVTCREPFRIIEPDGGGVVEQVDGLIELKGRQFLVEMKWLDRKLDKPAASEHLVRVYHRPDVHGLFISATEFTAGALAVCREALQKERLIVLCTLSEIVQALEGEMGIRSFLLTKIEAVRKNKHPFPKAPFSKEE